MSRGERSSRSTLIVVRLSWMTVWVLVVCAACWSPNAAYGDSEAVLGELNRKSAEERLKLLTDGARKERVQSFYGSAPVGNS